MQFAFKTRKHNVLIY